MESIASVSFFYLFAKEFVFLFWLVCWSVGRIAEKVNNGFYDIFARGWP